MKLELYGNKNELIGEIIVRVNELLKELKPCKRIKIQLEIIKED